MYFYPLTNRKQALIAAARAQHGDIQPCSGKRSLEDCFTDEAGVGLIFWFNTPDHTTRIIKEES